MSENLLTPTKPPIVQGENEDEIYDTILAEEPIYPSHMPRDSVDLLQKLLTKEPESRLGSGPNGALAVMDHPFFQNIDWDDIYYKRVTPPFLPEINSSTDVSNFDEEYTSLPPILTPVQSGMFSIGEYFSDSTLTDNFLLVLTQTMQEEFRGFSHMGIH